VINPKEPPNAAPVSVSEANTIAGLRRSMAASQFSKNYYKQQQESLADSYRKTLEFEAFIAPYRIPKERIKELRKFKAAEKLEEERENYLKDIRRKFKDLRA